jgi:hypothetical protein
MKGLHEVVCHIIGAQRGVGYERYSETDEDVYFWAPQL